MQRASSSAAGPHPNPFAPQPERARPTVRSAQIHGINPSAAQPPLPARGPAGCPWLLVDVDALSSLPATVSMAQWRQVGEVRRPTDKDETLLVYRRVGTP